MSVLTDITGLRARASAGGHMPVRGRPAVMTLTLCPDWTGLPAATELASLLLRVPVAGVRFVGPVDLSALPGHVVVRVIALQTSRRWRSIAPQAAATAADQAQKNRPAGRFAGIHGRCAPMVSEFSAGAAGARS